MIVMKKNEYVFNYLYSILANSSRKDAEWSENLDKVFISNYERDRSLSWQYFGSATGILRHYPGILDMFN